MEYSSKQLRETNQGDPSEAEAIRLACAGNANGFETLYKLHSRRVYGLCLRMTGNPAEAEELTQESFMQLFRKIHTFRGESSFSTWLYRLSVNTVLMRLRKNQHPEVSLDASTEANEEDRRPFMALGEPDLRLSGMLDNITLRKAIDQLAAGYKEVLILHDVEGYKHHEIAQILGCSVGNSKSQLFKARLKLRNLLKEAFHRRAQEEH
jgi:RNA polymerase sigma-70 factor (ECF subfamily)